LLVLLLVLGAPALARAAPAPRPMKPAARTHYERGLELYQTEHYAEAAHEFASGYELDPWPEFLYALGQSYRKLGNCKKALDYYEAIMATGPTPIRATVVKTQIQRCQAGLQNGTAGAAAAAKDSSPEADAAAAPNDAVVEKPAPAQPAQGPRGMRRLHLDAMASFDAGQSQTMGEFGLSALVAPLVDVGATVFGDHYGVAGRVELHGRQDQHNLRGLALVRMVYRPHSRGNAVGGGGAVGMSAELGPGRVRVTAGVDLYSAPAAVASYAAMFDVGYQLDFGKLIR
jgi:hypothetical protein